MRSLLQKGGMMKKLFLTDFSSTHYGFIGATIKNLRRKRIDMSAHEDIRMLSRLLSCLIFVTALFLTAGESASSDSTSATNTQYAAADANSCRWVEKAPDWVRSPIQMDIHAGYRIFAFYSDGTIGYRVRGEFPYAAFMSFTIYDNAFLYAALTDYVTNVRTSLTRKCQDIADLKAGLCRDIADPIQASLNLVISFDRSFKGGL
jgi:hypothetical protein